MSQSDSKPVGLGMIHPNFESLVQRIIQSGGIVEVLKARIEADRKQGKFATRI